MHTAASRGKLAIVYDADLDDQSHGVCASISAVEIEDGEEEVKTNELNDMICDDHCIKSQN